MYEVEPISIINFGATGVEEILQNVAFILSTFKNTCPLDREFSYAPALDMPIHVGPAINANRIIVAIQEFEPRVEVISVENTGDPLQGKIVPKVTVRINDESI